MNSQNETMFFIHKLNAHDNSKFHINQSQIQNVYDTLLQKQTQNQPLYEYLQPEQNWVKPYFDIDTVTQNKIETKQIQNIVEQYKNTIQNTFDIQNKNDIFVVGGNRPIQKQNDGKWKFSLHITIDNHIIHKNTLVKYKNSLKNAGFDPSVYKNTLQKFRMIAASKDDDPHGLSKLFPYQNDGTFLDTITLDDLKKSCIQYFHPSFKPIHQLNLHYLNQNSTSNNTPDNIPDNIPDNTQNDTQNTLIGHNEKSKGPNEAQNKNNYITFNDVEKLELIDLIDTSLIDDYEHWTHIVWAMRNEGYTQQDARLISQKSPKFNEENFLSLWNRQYRGDNPLSMGTLREYAKKSQPQKYKNLIDDILKRNEISQVLRNCPGTEQKIADLIDYFYKDKYVYAPGNRWFMFDGNRWKEDFEAIYLRNDIKTIGNLFEQEAHCENIDKNFDDFPSPSESTKNTKNSLANKMKYNAMKMQSSTFKNGIIKEAQVKFCDHEFVDKLDTNTELLGFNNGVYDLKNDLFRPQKITDYISLTVGYDYTDEENKEAHEFVETFLSQVFPNENVRTYVLKMFSRQLIGDSCGNYVHIHSGHNGSAANGKSTFFEILTLALGRNYVTKFDINDIMFAKKGGVGSSAEPMKANWKGKRILYASEPDKNAQIQSQLVKDISSDETVKFRLNHGNVYYEFEPMYKIHIMCNDKPKADMNDEGVIRRLVNIEYISQFVNQNSVDESKNKFKMINNIKTIFKNNAYKLAFFKVIKSFLDPNWDFSKPPEIEEATHTYRNDNNPLLQFVNTYLVNTNNEKNGLSLKEIKNQIRFCGDDFAEDINCGPTLKFELSKILKTKFIDQTTVNNVKKKIVFRRWKFKEENNQNDNDLEQ